MENEIETYISELEDLSIQYPEKAKDQVGKLLSSSRLNISLQIRCLHIVANAWRTKNSFKNASSILKEVDSLLNGLNKNEHAERTSFHYIEWARLFIRFHKYEEAISFLNKARDLAYENKLEPIAHSALAILADIEFEMQNIERAWEILTELIHKESLHQDSIMLTTFQVKLADLYVYCDAYEQAKELLIAAEKNALEEDHLLILIARLDYALSENDIPELKKLTTYLEQHKDLLDDSELLYLTIASWNRLEEFEKAENAIKKLEIHYFENGHWHNLAYLYSGALEIYRSSGKLEEGKEFFHKALQIVGENPQESIMWLLYNSYGRVLWESDEKQDALESFQMATDFLENYRMSIPEDHDRISFFADKVDFTLDYVDFSISSREYKKALYFLESSKSLSLLDQLEMDSQTKTLGFHTIKKMI